MTSLGKPICQKKKVNYKSYYHELSMNGNNRNNVIKFIEIKMVVIAIHFKSMRYNTACLVRYIKIATVAKM